MNKNNLPIKLVIPKIDDMVPNTGGGKLKFFGEVTSELKKDINDKFETLLSLQSHISLPHCVKIVQL